MNVTQILLAKTVSHQLQKPIKMSPQIAGLLLIMNLGMLLNTERSQVLKE